MRKNSELVLIDASGADRGPHFENQGSIILPRIYMTIIAQLKGPSTYIHIHIILSKILCFTQMESEDTPPPQPTNSVERVPVANAFEVSGNCTRHTAVCEQVLLPLVGTGDGVFVFASDPLSVTFVIGHSVDR